MSLLSVLTLGQPEFAHATRTGPLELSYRAPDGCPTARELEADVRDLLATTPAQSDRLEAQVEVRRSAPDQWEADMTTRMRGLNGARTISGATCAEVTHAAALVLSLMLRPRAPLPEPRPPRAAAPAPAPPTRAPPPASTARPRSGGMLVRSAVLVGTGTLPGVEAGYALHLGLASHWAAVELRGGVWLPKTASSSRVAEAGADFWLLEAGLAGCWRLPLPPLRLDTCAGPKILSMSGQSFGVTDPGRARSSFAAAFVEQGLQIALAASVGLRLSAELVWPPSRPSFAIADLEEIHRPGPVAGRAGLAFELSF